MKLTRSHFDFYASKRFNPKGRLSEYRPKHIPSIHTLINSQVMERPDQPAKHYDVHNTYVLCRMILKRGTLIKSGKLSALIMESASERFAVRRNILYRIRRNHHKAQKRVIV